jgi:hypothetical protein
VVIIISYKVSEIFRSKMAEKHASYARISGLRVYSDEFPAVSECVNGHLDMVSTPTEAISLEQL